MVIGLGQFGMSLSRTLSEKGVEVMAVDRKKILVDEAAGFVTEAVVTDATVEEHLHQLEPARRDAVVLAMGDGSREASIICTALLRQMGAKYIVARANDKTLQRILRLVGAHHTINPELEFGRRFAHRLLHGEVIADTSLGDDLYLTEIRVPASFAGKTLIDLSLPKKFEVIVAAVRKGKTGRVERPVPGEPLRSDDTLIIVSQEASVDELLRGVQK